MTRSCNVLCKRIPVYWIGLLLVAPLLASGCASKTQYKVPKKVAIQEAALDSDPANKMSNLSHDELVAKANLYLKNGNRNLAKLHYRKALDKDPRSTAAITGLSKALVREGQFEEASQLLEGALEIDADNAPALLMLGIVKRQRGDLDASLDLLQKALEQQPNNPEILTELAITNDHIGQERLAYAEPLYKKVITLQPRSSAAHNNLGFNYLLQGRHQEAANAFSRALVLSPANQRAKNNLGAAYLLNNQADEALKLFQDTVGLAAAYNNLGYIQMTRGYHRQAEKAFKKALQLDPTFYVRAQENLERLERLTNTSH